MIYVDDLVEQPLDAYHGDAKARRVGARNGHRWCHLYADTEEELHAFAVHRLRMERKWAQRSRRGIPHYDLVPSLRARAVLWGAKELTRAEARELRERLRSAA